MQRNNADLTDRNLDRLSVFLDKELSNSTLVSQIADGAHQIADGAHLFHGAHNDPDLTHENLDLAAKLLLGMTLGYVEDAPLIMVFENKEGRYVLLDLSETLQKEQAQAFIGRFQKQSQKKIAAKLNRVLAS